MQELLKVSEAAKLLKVSKDMVYELIKEEYLPHLKLGSVKIAPWWLEEFININVGVDFSDKTAIRKLEIRNGYDSKTSINKA